MSRSVAWLTNGIVFATAGVVALLVGSNLEFYLRIVQEDDLIEWGTFWAFMLAMVAFLISAKNRWRADGRFPWFLVGVGIFAFLVAMEEISWGQRVFGYRPPTYFLEHNFQQELNVHNVMDKGLRKLVLKGIILGYGVVLPLLALNGRLSKIFAKIQVVPPALALAPAFLLTFLVYEIYPWSFSGEVVELLLGFCFLFAGMQSGAPPSPRRGPVLPYLVASALVLLLGLTNGYTSRAQRQGHPETVVTARTEVEALRQDFQEMADGNRGRPVTKCGLHKRLYSYVEKYEEDDLRYGVFASLEAQGLPEERADFFLDPWNSPYWIRHECNRKTRSMTNFVYSFGPNRLRDSTEWEILGDDVGIVIFETGPGPSTGP